MKRLVRVLRLLCIAVFVFSLSNCGGGSSTSAPGTTKVTVSIGQSKLASLADKLWGKSSSAIPSNVATIRIVISGDGAVFFDTAIDVSGKTQIVETFDVPNGLNRDFFAEAKDANGVSLYQGDTKANLNGTPQDITIQMEPVGGGSTVTLIPGTAARATLVTEGNTINLNFPANAVSQQTVATLAGVLEGGLPAPISAASAAAKKPSFTLSPDNVFVLAFTLTTDPSITTFNVPISMDGTLASTSTITSGTTLNLAIFQNNTWVDVATVIVGSNGLLTENLLSTTLQGIITPGTYVLYKPAPGGSTTVSNLGIALIADDGFRCADGSNCLQVINLYDANGNPLSTPAIKYLDYAGAGDIDGQALTPDGSQGILVDGGNTVRFFSQVQTGVPIASTTTLDVSAYGGDGDSVAIMPNGDEAVVSADSSSVLLLISGIVSGNPQPAATIPIPGNRDGVVISNDGAVLLARGSSGLTVFAIAPVAPAAGPLGGTVSHSFTQIADIAALGSVGTEDGRNGIAISPKDSTRAVIIGSSTINGFANVTLVTGLTTSPSPGTPVTIAGANFPFSVAITPDGKNAIVGTEAGLAMFSGVDTGALKQEGTLFAPTYAGIGGSVTMRTVPTLGITLDGKFVVACDSGALFSFSGTGSLLVIPITATGFGSPVGVLNGIAVPSNDQMVIH